MTHATPSATLARGFRLGAAALVFLGVLAPAAAENFPFPPGSSLRFRHITLEDGLAQSSVSAIDQDTQGYIWLGTQDGLQRYDGYDFLTYRHDPNDPASLADNDVGALAVDPGGALWIGTSNVGLDRLDPGTGHFTHFQHDPARPDSLADNDVLTLLLDHAGRLWVGTFQGLDRMDTASGAFKHYKVPSEKANANEIFSIFEDHAGRLWVGTAHGLYYFDPRAEKLLPFVPTGGVALKQVQDIFADTSVGAFADTQSKLMWVATRKGIVVLDDAGRVRQFYVHKDGDPDSLPSSHVRALIQDSNGDIWIGTAGGVSRYDAATQHFSNYQHDATDPGGLSDDDIYVIYRDRTGLIWIGTGNAGANIYNPQTRAFGYYRHKQGDLNSLASNTVWDIYKDSQGELWVASDKGLTRLDPTRRHYTQYKLGDRPKARLDDDSVNVVFGGADGTVWAGTDYGVYRYLPASNNFRHYNLVTQAENPLGNYVYSIDTDSKGRLWLGTGQGLVQLDPQSGAIRRLRHDPARADSLPDDGVSAMCETTDKSLWVATSNGLGRFDGDHDHFAVFVSSLSDASSISYNNLESCLPDKDGNLWVGTASGLDYLDLKTGKFKRYFVSNGLPNNTIYSILPDAGGGIWVSTGNGLSHFDAAAGTFHNYGTSDGLQSDEFNGGSSYAAPDGELFFGGINGMNAFYPSHLVRNEHPPQVAITRFLRAGEAVPLESANGPVSGVEVRYRENILSAEFTAFDFAAPGMNTFMYKLEGFDSDWHTVHGRRTVTYTNLDPGHYTLRVRGANNDGVWSTQEATLGISVLPPAWRTWWAYLLYAAVSFVAVMLALRIYKRTIKREHDLENEQQRRRWAEALHNLIQSVTALRDERSIAEQLIDTITNFIQYDRALFYVERDVSCTLIASRGISEGDQDYLEHWPMEHARILARLRHAKKPMLLSPEDAETLDGGSKRPAPRHYLAVPLFSGSGAFRLLLVGRALKSVDKQQMDVAGAMARQVSVALDNAQLIKELENLATTDGLTRLYNRRHFMERAESEFERSRRYQRELSVLLLDADHFKNVNDTYGHEVGDRVLRVLANACRQCLRQLDVLGRYGGEEFVVLLPETPAALAFEAAERLRSQIQQLRIPTHGDDVRITVSIGVATATSATESIAALINEADRALYEAKRSGRNHVVAAAGTKERV